MKHPARVRAIARPRRTAADAAPWLAWLALAAALLAAASAHAQSLPAQAANGPTDGRTAPPAISQPNGGDAKADGGAAAPGGAPGGLPRGSDGVITPPATVDPGMPIARPNPDAFPTPTLRPPGTPGGDPKVVPK